MATNQSILHPATDCRGFTLIEALVALGVLTIGILTVYTMQTSAVRGNFRASQITTASALAMDRMEQISGLPYDDAKLDDVRNDGAGPDTNGDGIDDDDQGLLGDAIANFGLDQNTLATADHTVTDLEGYTLYYNVADNRPLENMKTIRLIVVRETDQQPLVFEYYKTGPL